MKIIKFYPKNRRAPKHAHCLILVAKTMHFWWGKEKLFQVKNKTKQNLKKERGQNTENGWEVEREIHNTYTTCPSDQERETDDKENRSNEER